MSSQVRQVKEATDIVQIIGERVTLQRSGKNYRGLCPFHGERSPSFFVSPDIQSYKCFGCSESGDVFTFLEKYDGLTFSEALHTLADRAGITLTQEAFSPKDEQRERLFAILNLAKEYYHFLLTKHEVGEEARVYLRDRGTTQETIKQFELGYSLPGWDGLIKYLVGKKKFAITDLELAGLVIRRNGAELGSQRVSDFYDRFRGRVMFPLTDHRGKVVGFSGRVLNPDEKSAKYINSPETQLYHKSELLFGLSHHFNHIRKENSVIVVEGEFDVLSSSQAHVRNVVAIKGSVLTPEHVKRLARVVETITLSLDADSAGVEATKRAIDIASQFDTLRIRVLDSSKLGGKDPDDVAREHPDQWRKHVKNSLSAYQFLIDTAFAQHSSETGEGKQGIVAAIAPVLFSIPHAVERAHYMAKVAQRLGVSEALLQQDIQRYRQRANLSSRSNKNDQKVDHTPTRPLTVYEKTERLVLTLLFQFPEEEILEHARLINTTNISTPPIVELLQKLQTWQGAFTIRQFVQSLPPELESVFASMYLNEENTTVDDKMFKAGIHKLQQLQVHQQIEALTHRLEQLDADAPPDEQDKILRQIVQLRAQLVKYDE